MENKAYTLRTLNAGDIFPMLRILSKVGVKEISKCFEAEDVRKAIAGAANGEETDVASVGMAVFVDMAGLLMENLPDCKDEIFKFLSSLSGMSVADIAALSMADFAEIVIDVVHKEEFKDFFTAVARLFKQAT